MKDYLKYFIFRYVLLYFVLSFICLFIMPTTAFIIMAILVVLFTYYLKRKNRLYPHQFQIQLTIILIILVCLTIVSLLSQGYLSSQLWNYYYILYFPFALFLLNSHRFPDILGNSNIVKYAEKSLLEMSDQEACRYVNIIVQNSRDSKKRLLIIDIHR